MGIQIYTLISIYGNAKEKSHKYAIIYRLQNNRVSLGSEYVQEWKIGKNENLIKAICIHTYILYLYMDFLKFRPFGQLSRSSRLKASNFSFGHRNTSCRTNDETKTIKLIWRSVKCLKPCSK